MNGQPKENSPETKRTELGFGQMDVNLETPASAVPNQNEEKDESSVDEDQVLDWSKVAYVRLAKLPQVTRTNVRVWIDAERRKDAQTKVFRSVVKRRLSPLPAARRRTSNLCLRMPGARCAMRLRNPGRSRCAFPLL